MVVTTLLSSSGDAPEPSSLDPVLSLAHVIHYSLLAAGIVGLLLLLVAPRIMPAARGGAPDEHESRVLALRASLMAGVGGVPAPLAPQPVEPVASVEPSPGRSPDSTGRRLLLPLAVTGSGAAAVVHVAVGPEHFLEGAEFGLFFMLLAALQLAWSAAVALRPSRTLLVAGMVGNAATIGLWMVTRTVGLPWGLLPEPEEVGAWDLASVAWELVVVACCLALIGSYAAERADRREQRLSAWPLWHPAARLFLAVSVLVLVVISLGVE